VSAASGPRTPRWRTTTKVPPVKRTHVLVVAAVLALAGCTGSDTSDDTPQTTAAASPPPWVEPSDYTFVADRTCDGAKSNGKYKVTVAGKQVTGTERVDGKATEGEEEFEVPTLAGMLEEAQTAIDDGADATTTFDPADGHPIAVAINRAEEENGGATCFQISDYRPRS
jgi:hypothetical protein